MHDAAFVRYRDAIRSKNVEKIKATLQEIKLVERQQHSASNLWTVTILDPVAAAAYQKVEIAAAINAGTTAAPVHPVIHRSDKDILGNLAVKPSTRPVIVDQADEDERKEIEAMQLRHANAKAARAAGRA